MRKKSEEFIGTYQKDMWRSTDRLCLIGICEGDMKVVVKSLAEPELTPGMTYRFLGQYEDHVKGKQFKVEQFQIREPNSRKGLTTYLAKYAPNIGPAIASKLYDAFGSDAVMILRTRPEAASAACRLLTLEKAEEAAKVLRSMTKLEETKIALLNLFTGRGFPGALIDECVGKWGILAPERVRRDPFTMLVQGMSGAGFARCDRMYMDFGLNERKLKRQVICLWHELQSSTLGHTWHRLDDAARRLGEMIGGVKANPAKALRLGVRSGWLAVKADADGVKWIASGKQAENEAYLAERVCELLGAK